MYPAAFDYHRATSFSDAVATLVTGGSDAKALAGGQTLIPMMKLRLLKPRLLVDLGGIADASDIAYDDDMIEIGALARHAAIGGSAVATQFPIIKDCALGIADPQVRNMGTIGGSVAEADPNSCWPTLLFALDAAVLCVGPAGERAQRVRDLLADAYTPDLDAGELITRIAIERSALDGFGAFVAFKRCAPAYPTGSCALQISFEGDRIGTARMAFGCLGLTPFAFDAVANLVVGQALNDDLVADVGAAAAEAVDPISDAKGTAAYKRSLVGGLVKRAFAIVDQRRRGLEPAGTHSYYG